MTDIFEALRVDHDIQRELVVDLLDTQGASGDRTALFSRLTDELAAHAAHEERHFYVPLIEHDATQDLARHSIAEHKDIDDLVERLEGYELTAPQWLLTAEELADRIRHHLAEEEREVFPAAGRVLGEGEKTALAGAYAASMERERESA